MPVASQNEVEPGQTMRMPLASFVHTLEVRLDNRSNRFSPADGWMKFGEIAGACAAGTMAVGLGAGAVLGAFSGHTRAAIGGLAAADAAWRAAHAGGARFGGTIDGVVLMATDLWIPFHEKHYSVRQVNGNFALWDEDEDRSLS